MLAHPTLKGMVALARGGAHGAFQETHTVVVARRAAASLVANAVSPEKNLSPLEERHASPPQHQRDAAGRCCACDLLLPRQGCVYTQNNGRQGSRLANVSFKESWLRKAIA